MKEISFSLVLMAISSAAFSQMKASKDTTLSLPSVRCDMSKTQIETYLKRIDGVTYVNVTPKKKAVRIKFLDDRTNLEAIKAHIANTGYDVEELAANADSYHLLPKCCKKR